MNMKQTARWKVLEEIVDDFKRQSKWVNRRWSNHSLYCMSYALQVWNNPVFPQCDVKKQGFWFRSLVEWLINIDIFLSSQSASKEVIVSPYGSVCVLVNILHIVRTGSTVHWTWESFSQLPNLCFQNTVQFYIFDMSNDRGDSNR